MPFIASRTPSDAMMIKLISLVGSFGKVGSVLSWNTRREYGLVFLMWSVFVCVCRLLWHAWPANQGLKINVRLVRSFPS